MENNEIMQYLKEMSGQMQSGFDGISKKIDDLESRVGRQEKRTHEIKNQQAFQECEIAKLKEIVQDLAIAGGTKTCKGTAIYKEPAYEEIERRGFDRRKAMQGLKDAKAIRTDSEGKTTCTIRIDGRPQRVIVVCN